MTKLYALTSLNSGVHAQVYAYVSPLFLGSKLILGPALRRDERGAG